MARTLRADPSGSTTAAFSLLFHSLPRTILEALYPWMVQSCLLVVKVQTDLDDHVILNDHCDFLVRVLKVVLSPKLRHLESDFILDMRNFGNFTMKPVEEADEEESQLEALELRVTEEVLGEHQGAAKISQTFAEFLETSAGLATFLPGILLTDRSRGAEPQGMSLVFTSPQVAINMVRCCSSLTSLSMEGYADLSDIVLEFVSGEHPDSPGLPLLSSLHLPERSFLTEEGVRSLLQHLPLLRSLVFPGNLGQVFELPWEPVFGPTLLLETFSQLMSVSSGGVEEGEEEGGEVACWSPGPTTVARVARLCPRLRSLRVLMEDMAFPELVALAGVEEVEAHLTWAGGGGPPHLASPGQASRRAVSSTAAPSATPWPPSTSPCWIATPGPPSSL